MGVTSGVSRTAMARMTRVRRRARARTSETRLQVTIVPKSKRDDVDLYADVPCTD